MKKTLFLLPLLTLASLSINGCRSNDKKARITYGTLVDDEAEELVYGSLSSKAATNKENMLISVITPYSESCGCWTQFKTILDEYVRTYKTKIYYICTDQFSDGDDTFGLKILQDTSAPTFALIKDGKVTNQYVYSSDTKIMFEDLSALRKTITKIARDPQYFLVDQEYLDNALFSETEKKEKVVIHYIWHFCPDCNDCLPNVLTPYSNENEFSTNVWVINLAVKGILLNDSGVWEGTGIQTYVDFLKEHQMSYEGNETFGYDRGFVPTTQVWENGELKDMTVYFNDGISKVDGKYQITRSYYDEDRISNLGYTSEVLLGKTLSEEEVDVSVSDGVESYSWNSEYAREYHKPILEAFLDKYVK